eukprot:358553-Chlamydomonas_euryale.AAC.3
MCPYHDLHISANVACPTGNYACQLTSGVAIAKPALSKDVIRNREVLQLTVWMASRLLTTFLQMATSHCLTKASAAYLANSH